jgi:hypothetical protein
MKSEEAFKTSLAELVRQSTSAHEKEIARLQDMLHASNKERATQCQAQEAYFKDLLMTAKRQSDADKEREIARLQDMHSKISAERAKQFETQNKEIKEAYDALKVTYSKDLVSSQKGKQGEKEIDELVAEFTRWGPLINTSKLPHATDRSCKIKGCDTFFEVKNYADDVPSKEVAKFQRDMEEHADVPLGVFISLKTNIVGKKGGNFIQFEWTSHSQLLIYINSFYTHSAEDCLAFIDNCADIALSMYKLSDRPEDSDVTLMLQTRINQAKLIAEKELKKTTELLTTLNLNKKTLIETITKHHTDSSQHIKHSLLSLKELIGFLAGTEVDEESAASAPKDATAYDPAAPKEAAPKKKSSKTKPSAPNTTSA